MFNSITLRNEVDSLQAVLDALKKIRLIKKYKHLKGFLAFFD